VERSRGDIERARPRVVAAVVLALVALTAAGCSETSGTPSPSIIDVDTTSVFYQQYRLAILAEASEEQIAVLKTASETEALDYADVNALVEQALACVEDAGLSVVRSSPEELGPDYLIPRYSTGATAPGMSDAQAAAVSNACIDKHSYFAEVALQTSPQAVDARDNRLRAQLTAIIECLNSNGVTATADETPDEIRQKVTDLLVKTHEVGTDVMCYDDFSVWWSAAGPTLTHLDRQTRLSQCPHKWGLDPPPYPAHNVTSGPTRVQKSP